MYPDVAEAGQSLHAMIVDGCGNQVLSDTIRGLQDHFDHAARFLLESIVNQPSNGGPVRLALSMRT